MNDITQDPIRQIGSAKHWAQAGIAWAVFLLLAFYYFALDLSILDLTFVIIPAAVAAFVAIEIASRWEIRMHRRYYYPQQLGFELAKIHDFDAACAASAGLVYDWLDVHAAVIGWLEDDGETIRPMAARGMPEAWVDIAPEQVTNGDGAGHLRERSPVFGDAAEDPWFASFGRDRVIYVPLVSRDVVEGVLALCAGRGNTQVTDRRLLAALGVVLGLALDNCRLYEGQRAHAEHFQELNRMKSDFLTTVSHELRTPLTSIMMGAEMLLEEEETRDPNSTRGKLVRSIVKGSSRLSSLVSDLVNVSRDDDFQPRLELDYAPLKDILSGAISVVQPLFAAKHQSFDLELTDPDAQVLVDRLRFEQVLINLLSNAQRYSPPAGHIWVGSRTLSAGDTMICVSDSGPGVATADRERIFEPFYRGDRNGLGLGLAIAKSIVELHSGRIWVEPAPNGGSAFCVVIPGKSDRPVRDADLKSPLHAARRRSSAAR
ncbi:MAG: ATP-binding protein [Dehalococcoidia bacterium]